MRRKRYLAILCVLTILCSFLRFGELRVANSYEVTVEEDFLWEEIGNNEVRILGTNFTRVATKIVIPEKIDGKDVVEIGEHAFSSYENLKSVMVPKTVSFIDWNAFSFSFCMEEVIVAEDNLNYRSENGALYSKNKSELYYVPAAMNGEFVIPWEVDLIIHSAFESCACLESVRFEHHSSGKSSASAMGENINGLFSECAGLKEILVEEGHLLYQSVDGALLLRDGKTLLTVPYAYEAEEYIVPEGVEQIDTKCFSFCENIESIRLPNSIRRFDELAFYGCIKLREVTIAEGVRELAEGTFFSCKVLKYIKIPDSVVWVDGAFAKNCNQLTMIEADGREGEIWESLQNGEDWERGKQSKDEPKDDKDEEQQETAIIEEPEAVVLKKQASEERKTDLFAYSLIDRNSVVIMGMTETAKEAKENRELIIPDVIDGASVVGIAERAFAGVPLTSVVLPESLQEIGRGAFYGCNLKQVKIPKHVCYIAPRAFGANYGLERIDVEEDNETYTSCFGCLYTLEKTILLQVPANYAEDIFSVPESVEVIGEYAFGNSRNIKEVQMKPDGVEIREKAFWNMLSCEQ